MAPPDLTKQSGGGAYKYPTRSLRDALAHVNSNAAEAAYQRSDLFDLRRKLMESWASFLAVKRGEVRAIR